jgi:thiamine-monophosphate kinase
MRLSELGELGLLEELARRGLARRIENDAAQLRDGLVVTQDALVEGVHFRLDWISWRDLGFRVAAVNLSDLAASGAEPEALVVTLAVPGETELEDVLQLYAGIAEAGVEVVGGDTTAAERVVLSATAIGRSERVPGRGGARPGDVLVVTGPLGAAGAAFRQQAYVRPPVRLEEGRRLAGHAHALLDVSDGLALDAGHIGERSSCRLVVDLERVPLAKGAELSDLGFGEDYELLAAVADSEDFPVIGRCEEGEGVVLRLHGEPHELPAWEHFRPLQPPPRVGE